MIITYKTNENHFRIKKKGVINVYYLHQVSSLTLVKQRDFTLNIACVFSSLICYAIANLISEIFTAITVLSFLCSGLFLIISFIYTGHSYKMMIVTNESRTSKFSVNILELEDIEQMVSKIDKALTMDRFSHAYTNSEMGEAPDLKQKNL